MTVYVAFTVGFFLYDAGSYGRQWLGSGREEQGWLSLLYLALGAFGIYALIVGK